MDATGSRYRPHEAMFLFKLELNDFEANSNSGGWKTSMSESICDCCLLSLLVVFAMIHIKRQPLSTQRANEMIG